jgi:peptidoglycan/LPS O-acetylase OafA/YrhL
VNRRFPRLKPESDHLLHLDALRLIASAGIVCLHLSGFADVGVWSKQWLTATGPLRLFVDMFFVVSGFVIAFVYFENLDNVSSFKAFMQKRLARLVPLHWATLAICFAIGLMAESRHIAINNGEVYELRCLPVNFLLLHSTGLCSHLSFNGPSWSISAEMCMYVMAPALFWIMRRNLPALGLATASIWLTLTVLTNDTNLWLDWTASGGFVRAIPSFMFGSWLFGARRLIAGIPFARVGFWVCVWGFLVGCCIGAHIIALLLILYATVAMGVAADAQQRPSWIVRTMAAGGQLTYSSYLLHQIVILILLNGLANHALHLHGLAKNLMVLTAFAVVWPVSYLSLVLFEKPARRWLSGISSVRQVR